MSEFNGTLVKQRQRKTTAILRVFNCYRVFLSFALLLLFLQVPEQELVGKLAPHVFQHAIIAYICFNTLVSLASPLLRITVVASRAYILSVLIADVVMLSLLLYASGGVSSGMANFLIFPVAYAGVLLYGRASIFLAAIAVLLGFYSEIHLMMSAGGIDSRKLFNIGILGAVLFAVNGFFQYLTVQLRRKEEEVTTLERLNRMRALAERRKSELDRSNRRFGILLDCAGDGVLGLDLHGHITFANPRAAQLLEVPRLDLIGRPITDFLLIDLDHDENSSFQASGILHRLELDARGSTHTVTWQRDAGETFPVNYSCKATTEADGEVGGAVVVFQDATERKRLEAEMYHLANYDGLTNLVNRGYFHTNLDKAISRARRTRESLAVLLLDLDHFKYVNDRYGHHAGDAMLREVSARMTTCIRNSDTASRLGGDEFAILLTGYGNAQNLAHIAGTLIQTVARPVIFEGQELEVSTSIGIAVFDDPSMTGDEMMKCADTAMYAAKSDGRNTWRFFRREMQAEAEHTQRIQVALQNAVSRNEFHVDYQPIVSLRAPDTIHHWEALVRWNPKGEDPISPDIFIPIAEETGKIAEIGKWVLDHVLAEIRAWYETTGVHTTVAINVSTRQLGQGFFPQQLKDALLREQLPPTVIEIELTETGVMSNPQTVVQELEALHEMGIRISIDDFGTGHSSLDYLRRMPIDHVKVDKSFTAGIGAERNDENIIKAIIAIARAMNMRVIAEGIEDPAQLDFLQQCGCALGQGYLFSRPMPSHAVPAQLLRPVTAVVSLDNVRRQRSAQPA